MSTDSKEGFKPDSTHGEFWGGYMLDKWSYGFLVIVGGFFGLDKLALRSPFTAFLKFVVNLFFFGAWYVYDILQLFDKDFVAKYGHTTPFGVSGHGYRMIHKLTENKIDEYENPSPYYGGIVGTIGFIAYIISFVFFGFTGLPNLIAGDAMGGLIKLFSNFAFGIPTFFYLLTPFITVWKMGSIGKDDVPHEFPLYSVFTIFKEAPAYNLISEEEGKRKLKAFEAKYAVDISGGKQPDIIAVPRSFLSWIYEGASMYPPIAATQTVSELKGMSKAFSNVAQKAALSVGKVFEKNPDAAVSIFAQPPPPAPVEETFTGTNPMVKQTGGALLQISPDVDKVILMSMGILIVGGLAAALLRKFSIPKREEEDEYPRKAYERDDPPPNPGRV